MLGYVGIPNENRRTGSNFVIGRRVTDFDIPQCGFADSTC